MREKIETNTDRKREEKKKMSKTENNEFHINICQLVHYEMNHSIDFFRVN